MVCSSVNRRPIELNLTDSRPRTQPTMPLARFQCQQRDERHNRELRLRILLEGLPLNSAQSIDVVVVVSLLLAVAVVSLAALWHRRRERRGGMSSAAIRQYRDWQGQCSSWSTYWELEEMIDEERAKGG